jgi:cytochrome P450
LVAVLLRSLIVTAHPHQEQASEHRRLPHPRFRLPLIGDVLRADLRKPLTAVTEESRRHDGIFEVRIFSQRIVVLTGAELIAEVNDESVWERDAALGLENIRALAGDGLATAANDNPVWHKAHNILMPAFTKSAMINYHKGIVDTVREFVDDVWNPSAESRSWVDVCIDVNRLTVEVIARGGFGYSFKKLMDTTEHPFATAVARELSYASRFTNAIPGYEQLFGRKRKRQHEIDKARIRSEVQHIIALRREQTARPGPPDMLDIMLHTADPDTGEKLDDTNIGHQLVTFLIAGSETSANATAFALHYLSTRTDVATQARAEVDARWPERHFPNIQHEDIAKLRYLRRVVDETLRLWPVSPGYFRRAKHDTTLGNGKYSFKKHDSVGVVTAAAHRAAPWGPDADEFNPDRFLPQNIRALPTYTYKPWGTGPRACIGRQFALHEIVLTLAAILHQYDLEPDPNYALTTSEIPALRPANLRLRLRRRQ